MGQYLCLVLTLCTSALVWKCSLFVIKFIDKNIYSHGRVKISSLWNRYTQEVWDLTPIMSLTIHIYEVNSSKVLLYIHIHKSFHQNTNIRLNINHTMEMDKNSIHYESMENITSAYDNNNAVSLPYVLCGLVFSRRSSIDLLLTINATFVFYI
jgi:hypothetical protein